MKPAKIGRGLGAIRRAQASGSVTGTLAAWGGPPHQHHRRALPGHGDDLGPAARGDGAARHPQADRQRRQVEGQGGQARYRPPG